jgi:lipopolysaccharide transport system permease protein
MFFLTAVVYPMEVVSRNLPPSLQWIFHLNPLSTMVEDLRRVMLKDLPPEWSWYLPTLVACLGVMVVGYAWFMHTKREFADVI